MPRDDTWIAVMDGDRRRVLKAAAALAGLAGFAGGARAVDNVLLGYGKNLRTQDLGAVVSERFPPALSTRVDGSRIGWMDGELDIEGTDAGSRWGAVEQLSMDLPELSEGEIDFEFCGPDDFFSREGVRRFTTDAVRGVPGADPGVVEDFAGTDPGETRELVQGLGEAFREETSYDVPRYLAGAVTDNVLMGTVKLRPAFSHDVDFGALRRNDATRMFCFEYVNRSVEALHSVPAHRQATPVVAGKVSDYRHKHSYTVLSTVVRDPGLKLVSTFLDYTRLVLGDELPVMESHLWAYDGRHRADRVHWTGIGSGL